MFHNIIIKFNEIKRSKLNQTKSLQRILSRHNGRLETKISQTNFIRIIGGSTIRMEKTQIFKKITSNQIYIYLLERIKRKKRKNW